MSHKFYQYRPIAFLNDVTKWNISNVNNMSYMFYEFKKLKYIINIDYWNTQM